MNALTRSLAPALAISATFVLSACGGSDSPGASSGAAANASVAAGSTTSSTATDAQRNANVGGSSSSSPAVASSSSAASASSSSAQSSVGASPVAGTTASSSSSASTSSASSSTASSSSAASACSTCSTTLQPRYLDAGRTTIFAYYDPALGITWLQNTNAGAGSAVDDGKYGNDGRMTWNSAMAWTASLSFSAPGAASGWRLPAIESANGLVCVFSATGGTACGQNVITTPGAHNYSEMAHMFQVTLGNLPAFSTSGGTNPTPWLRSIGPFSVLYQDYNVVWYGSPACGSDLRNCRDDAYWTNQTDSASGGGSAWKFLMGEGEQIGDAKNVEYFAWAVHDGDVGYP